MSIMKGSSFYHDDEAMEVPEEEVQWEDLMAGDDEPSDGISLGSSSSEEEEEQEEEEDPAELFTFINKKFVTKMTTTTLPK